MELASFSAQLGQPLAQLLKRPEVTVEQLAAGIAQRLRRSFLIEIRPVEGFRPRYAMN